MRKMKRKIIVYLLMLCMIIDVIPANSFAALAFAAEGDVDEQQEKIKLLENAEQPSDTLSLDEALSVTVTSAGEHVLLSFTASEAGAYTFTSSSQLDTVGYLYKDQGKTVELDNDDDSGDDSNFKICSTLDADETVYLEVYLYGNSTGTFDVTVTQGADESDSNTTIRAGEWIFDANYSSYIDDQGVLHLEYRLQTVSGSVHLTEGTDYTVAISQNGTPITGTPTQPGVYAYTATGIGNYSGSIVNYFCISNYNDLAAARYDVPSEFSYTGEAIDTSKIVVNDAMGNTVASSNYKLIFYSEDDEQLSDIPSEMGAYILRIQATTDGSCLSTNWDDSDRTGHDILYVGEFRIVDATDLSGATATIWANANKSTLADGTVVFGYTDSALSFNTQLVLGQENLCEGIDYTVTFSATEFGTQDVSGLATFEGMGTCCGTVTVNYILAGKDSLLNADCKKAEGVIDETSGEYQLDEIRVWDSLDDSGEPVLIPVEITGFAYRNDDGSYTPVEKPAHAGSYRITVVPTDEVHNGSLTVNLDLKSSSDLSIATFNIHQDDKILYTGECMDIILYDGMGNVVDPQKYTLTVKDCETDENKDPCEKGDYYMYASAKNGSGYTGHTDNIFFSICEKGSFDNCEFSLSNVGNCSVQDDGSFLIAYHDQPVNPGLCITECESWNDLEAGTDYTYSIDGPTVCDINKDQTGTITITGMGIYAGETRTITYTLGSKWSLINGFQMDSGQRAMLTDGTIDFATCLEYYDYNAKLLTYGTDYVVSAIYRYDNSKIDAITESGTYQVTLKGQGSYSGSVTLYLYVYEQGNARAYTWEMVHGAYVDGEGAVHLPEYRIVLPTGEVLATTLSDFEKMGGGPVEISNIQPGSIYTANCYPADPNYTGSLGIAFRVYAQNDLRAGTITIEGKCIEYTGSAIDTGSIVVKDAVGNVVDSSEYTLTFMIGEKLSTTIPTECGLVQVCAHANVGSAYISETGWERFRIVAPAKIPQILEVDTAQLSKSTTYSAAAAKTTTKVAVTGAEGEVTYSKVSGSSVLTVGETSGKITVAKDTSAGTYSVKVKISAAAIANYEAASKTVTVKVTVGKASQTISVAATQLAKSTTYSAIAAASTTKVAVTGAKGNVTYSKVSGPGALTVGATSGKITVAKGTSAGTYSVKVKISANETTNYKSAAKTVTVKVKVGKAAQTLSVASKQLSKTAAYSKSAASYTTKVAVKGAKRAVTYSKVSGSSVLSIGRTTGKIKVNAGTAKGTYSIKVKISAAASTNYKSAAKTVTVKVTVK